MSAGIPYEMEPMGGLEAQGGGSQCFEIPFPSRSLIAKLVVIQIGGTPVAFTAALFNSNAPCSGDSQSDSVGPDEGPLPPDLYRVTPEIASVNGSIQYFSDTSTGGFGFVFYSQTKGESQGRLGNDRRIFLRITPAGTGLKTFAVAIAGLSHN